MVLTESILSFFIEKSADKIVDKCKERLEIEKVKQEITSYSERFFKESFYQIPVSMDFDFQGLNDFLYENLETKVAICFNTLEIKKSKFFREQLMREAYEYAKADTREKQNIVFIYIQNILNIIENIFIDNVDGQTLFLAGCVVNDIQENMNNLLNSYSDKLTEFIKYHESFAESVDNMLHDFDCKNEYHYLNKNISFQGREDVLQYLDDFRDSPANFSFSVITGPGGIGKSKLMHHYMVREMSSLEWKIIFPTHSFIEIFVNQHNEWYYPKNLLIIIDYAGEITDVIGKWIDILSHTKKRPPKIRIIMLERQGVTIDDDTISYPLWYNQIKDFAGQNFEQLLYRNEFYSLKSLQKKDIFTLIDNIAKNHNKNISHKSKILIYNHSKTIGTLNLDHYTTPLMVILLTDAFLNNLDFNHLSTSVLMKYIIRKYEKYWLHTICKGDTVQYSSIKKLIVYATATGGWNLKQLGEPLLMDSSNFLDYYNKTDLELILSGISENMKKVKYLLPLEPDIVGEYFVLWNLTEMMFSTQYYKFIQLLWDKPNEFTYFLNRCINSYLCDKEFYNLIGGEYSLFGIGGSSYLKGSLLLNLTARLPVDRCGDVIEMLSKLTKEDSSKQNIALIYVRGLVNISFKQDVTKCKKTIDRLEILANDNMYSDNQEIMQAYARGLANLLNKQDIGEGKDSINKLEKLVQDKKYSENQEIVQEYAKGLVNFSLKQNVIESELTIKKLEELVYDKRYCNNQDILQAYSRCLISFSFKQELHEGAETINKLENLIYSKNLSNNQEIVLRYAMGLVNLSYKQDLEECTVTVSQLGELAKDLKYCDNQSIVQRYAMGLLNLAKKQKDNDCVNTVKLIYELSKDDRYSDNEEIVLRYARGLIIQISDQKSEECANTIILLSNIAKDERYCDNQEIVLSYAIGLLKLTSKQKGAECSRTVKQLAELAMDEKYSTNQKIILCYAKGLCNQIIEQKVGEECNNTVKLLAELAKDERYSTNEEIVLCYAKGLYYLGTEQKVLDCINTVKQIEELTSDERYSGNQEIVLFYASGLLDLAIKQNVSECSITVHKIAELVQDMKYKSILKINQQYANVLGIYGYKLYLIGKMEESGKNFFEAIKYGHADACINLAYMIRRGEFYVENESVEELLKDAVNNKNGLATVNMALYTAINKGEWDKADILMESLTENDETVLEWWKNELYPKGDKEGLLVITWLERHGNIKPDFILNPKECYDELSKKYPNIPYWIVEQKNYIKKI